MPKKPIAIDRQTLRAEAEVRLARDPKARASSQPSAALLHELQVHQIELEMQNEELRRDQLEIEAAHERYVDLYDFAPVGYLTVMGSGIITEANLPSASLLGEVRGNLLGRQFAAFVAPRDGDRWNIGIRDVFASDSPVPLELAIQREDGSGFNGRLDLLRVLGPDGPRVRVTLTTSGALQTAIFNSVHFSSIATDARGVIQIFNIGAEHMLGFVATEVVNRLTPADLSDSQELVDRARKLSVEFSASIAAGFEALVYKAARGIEDIYELTYVRKDGSRLPAEVSVTALRNAQLGIVGYLLIGTDNTARQLAREERDILRAQLAIASRLAAMGTLVAGVAHEINNPLAAGISGQDSALEIVREFRSQAREGGSRDYDHRILQLDEAIEALEDAQEGGQRIARIVKDMAALARSDLQRARVRLLSVVEDAVRFLPASVTGNATIAVEDLGPPDVLAAEGQITQVAVNLLTNAAKATPPGMRGKIVIRVGPGTLGMARLEVIDEGVGIDPANLGRIFDPFFTTRSVGEGRGTGLGLAISHTIVAAHGGTLTVESDVGKGSTFRVELPAAPTEA